MADSKMRKPGGILTILLFVLLLQPEGQFTQGQQNSMGPLVRLQRLEERRSHLHTDQVRYRESDSRLFLCSYTFAVVDARDPANMRYLAEGLTHTIPNDQRRPGCINLAWDGDIVYTTHRGNVDNPAFLTAWDISKPDSANPQKLAPVQLSVLQEPGVTYEGIDSAGGTVYVALRGKGLGLYRRNAANRIERIGTVTGLTDAVGVAVYETTAFVADGMGGLAVVNVADPKAPKLLGRVATGGQARSVVIDRNVAYVAAGSAGLVLVDVKNPAAPRVISRVTMPGTAVRVAYSKGRAFVAAWNDARAYDVGNPSQPRFIGSVRLEEEARFESGPANSGAERTMVTSRTLGIAAHNDVMFVGNWWVPYSYRLYADRVAPNLVLPEGANLIDFGPVPTGQSKVTPIEIFNQGTAPLIISENAVEGASFSVSPQRVQIAPGGTAKLSVTYRPKAGTPESGYLRIKSNDPAAPVRTARLAGNRPGLGVGKVLPEIVVQLLDGSEWRSTTAHNKVQLLVYFATF
jgi:hypothetical protein